ncbi:5'-nucleotidase C-terminal domain-containing protein [Tateyamaria armeniaca]|uniref:5'-nucleotidase C-terminal domain-containing protein n=1 Tax=Tateyamaria armeniaca TaxID=2518930 RepID=A0ABW8UUS4_9RHOB
MRHMAMLAPYPNAIWAAVLTGGDLISWVERAATFFSPTKDGCARLANPDAPSFNFDMLHGVEAVIDPFQPAMFDPIGNLINPTAKRVRKLLYQDAPVDLDEQFLVSMTSYRGAGGGNFPGISGNADILRTDHDLTEALHRAVTHGAVAFDQTPSVWRFDSVHQRAGDYRNIARCARSSG